ncbi:cobW-domain-containing protein [Suhomyces tanzawaensis NRRL Y-17324]|uniref:CobW-domain-containing protein n=1 Tax=Suhomyces tanzawaensis NRRL Y-17324 TaxID=984487 RepID=A0A1E4SM55_9ASCO|nr:cobW-domain-containing protein [Suhomyces tanzawaensis NRRL Y-17324]ODV80593.1 cobW-domain-containing protein [Suhomyces tanzawaensis NRRL Y-17324]
MDDIPQLVTELPADGTIPSERSTAPSVSSSDPTRKIPVTIITGYLGSGKSTLLENIGKTSKKKLAIILNEFGDSSVIEKSVTIKDTEKSESIQEWLDLGNGCLCCTVKDNGVVAIEQLVEKSKDRIDHILLETTGVADPAPIAKMFWLDEGLSSNIYIDGVVTVVDSEHVLKCLDDVGGHWHRENNHVKNAQTTNVEDLTEEELQQEEEQLQEGITTAHLQIALADTILINKYDKLQDKEKEVQAITDRIRSINGTSPIYTTSFGDIELDLILDLHAYEGDVTKVSKSLLSNSASFHDSRISTVTLEFPFLASEEQFDQIESFLQYILWENKINDKEVEIHRLKGLLVQKDPEIVKVVQGVRDTYDTIEGGKLLDGVKSNKLVLIGKNLNQEDLKIELYKYLK